MINKIFIIEVFPEPHLPHKLMAKLSFFVDERIAFASCFENSSFYIKEDKIQTPFYPLNNLHLLFSTSCLIEMNILSFIILIPIIIYSATKGHHLLPHPLFHHRFYQIFHNHPSSSVVALLWLYVL